MAKKKINFYINVKPHWTPEGTASPSAPLGKTDRIPVSVLRLDVLEPAESRGGCALASGSPVAGGWKMHLLPFGSCDGN